MTNVWKDRTYIKDNITYCSKCNTPVSHNKIYDHDYCYNCNIWLERVCSDPYCKKCKYRPHSPNKLNSKIYKDKKEIIIDYSHGQGLYTLSVKYGYTINELKDIIKKNIDRPIVAFRIRPSISEI